MKIGCTDVGTKTVGTILNGAYVEEVSQYTAPHIATVQVLDNDTVELPLVNSVAYPYDFEVDWGDGSPTENYQGTLNPSDVTHTYTTAGNYEITLNGSVPAFDTTSSTSFRDQFIKFQFGTDGPKLIKFKDSTNLNEVTGVLNTKNTFSISELFRNCTSLLYIDLTGWDTSHIISMHYCFSYTSANYDLSHFDFSSATNLVYLGTGSGITNLDLSNKSINSDLSYAFQYCLNLTAISFQNSTINNGLQCFFSCPKLENVNLTNTVFNGTNYNYFIYNSSSDVNQCNLNLINTSFTQFSVSCLGMFGLSKITELDFSNIDMSKVTNAYQMFAGYLGQHADFSMHDMSNITSFTAFISASVNLLTFKTSVNQSFPNCVTFSSMFNGCTSLESIVNSEYWVTSTTQSSLNSTFYNCSSLISLDCSYWDTSNITSFQSTWYGCINLATILGANNFNLTSLGNNGLSNTFLNCQNLSIDTSAWVAPNLSGAMTYTFLNTFSWDVLDLRGLNTTNITSLTGTFLVCRANQILVTGWNVSNVSLFNSTFGYITATELDLTGWTLNGGLYRIFQNATNLTNIIIPDGFVNSNVNTLQEAFETCTSLVSINTTNWDLSGITSTTGLLETFKGCNSLISLDLGTNSYNVVNGNMTSTFQDCRSLTYLNVPTLVGPNVSNIGNILMRVGIDTSEGCNLNISNWDSNSITNIYQAFTYIKVLGRSLDLSHFPVNVSSLMWTFYQTNVINWNLTNWDFSNITTMYQAFAYTKDNLGNMGQSIKVTVTNWNFAINTNFARMLDSSEFDTETTDKFLIDLEFYNQNNGYSVGLNNSQYTCGSSAETAKNNLIADHNVTFTDGGCI